MVIVPWLCSNPSFTPFLPLFSERFDWFPAGQFSESEPFTDDSRNSDAKPLAIRQLAIVVAIGLFIQVSKKMERFHAHVGSADPALQQRPKILHAVSVYAAIHVLDGMVNDLMRVLACQSVIREQSIGVECSTSFDVLLNFLLEHFFFAVCDYDGTDLPAALQHPHDGGFIFSARARDATLAFAQVHVPRFPTDKRFVGFDLADQLVGRDHSERTPNPVIHEPCRLLCHANGLGDLVTAHAIFAVHNLPHGEKPLVQTKRRILEDRASLSGKLSGIVSAATLPAVILGLEENVLAPATWAFDASGPAVRDKVLAAVVKACEVEDCGL